MAGVVGVSKASAEQQVWTVYCVLLRACALQNGNRPLHRAAECGHGDSVRLLVELGAGVNLSNHVSLRRAITLD